MIPLAASSTQGLVILNVVLAAGCLAALLAVLLAAWLDLRERRRWRALVPPCWPPPGVDPEAAYVTDLPRSARRPGGSRTAPLLGGDVR